MVETMKREKITFCRPCKDESDWKNENPMKRPDMIPRSHFAQI